MTKNFCWLVFATLFISLVEPALAIEPNELERSRVLFTDGDEHLKAGHFKEARDAFVAVLEVIEVPTVAWKAGHAQEKLGELVKAARLYVLATRLQKNEFWADEATQRKAQRTAQVALQELNDRIPTLKLELLSGTAPELEIIIDGNRIASEAVTAPLSLDPGVHVATAITEDGRSVTQTVNLAERDRKTVTLDLTKTISLMPPSPTPETRPVSRSALVTSVLTQRGYVASKAAHDDQAGRTQRLAVYTSVGVSAAGFVFGTTAGIISLVKRSDMKDAGCSSKSCPARIYDEHDATYDNWRTASTVGFVVAGVGAVTAVTLILVKPRREVRPRVSLMVGPNAMKFIGTF